MKNAHIPPTPTVHDLTQLEIPRLAETFNLTDGHAHRLPTTAESAILENMFQMFRTADREQQPQLEQTYIEELYKLTRQTVDHTKTKYLLLPSSSMSLELVGNLFRLKGYSMALTEPCFDNLANIFKRHGIPLEPIEDTCLESANWAGRLDSIQSDAICIVSPNNPTGLSYTRDNFEALVRHCQEQNRVLVLDTSFRAYRPDDSIFDEYAILQASGISYIVIEDTGKTWPTKELKVSVLATSSDLFQDIYNIYTDFIYHHSPFTISLVTSFIQHSQTDNLASVRNVIKTNRAALYQALDGYGLQPTEKDFSSVAWLENKTSRTTLEIITVLSEAGVYILPGSYFYWSDRSLGEQYLRVALVRDPAVFARAMSVLRNALAKLF